MTEEIERFEEIARPGEKLLIDFHIRRKEVETLDLTRLLTVFDVKRIQKRGLLRELFSSVLFRFQGFSKDPRPVHEIPEIRAYVRQLYQKFPYWFYTWDETGEGLPQFMYCLLDNITLVRREGSEEVYNYFDWQDLMPIWNRLTQYAVEIGSSVMSGAAFERRMQSMARILEIPGHLVEPGFYSR